jgi:hypothetical protein
MSVPLPQPLFQVFPVDDPEDQDHFVRLTNLIHESVVADAQARERILAALDCLDQLPGWPWILGQCVNSSLEPEALHFWNALER